MVMLFNLFYQTPLWVVFLALLVLFPVAGILGWQIGYFRRRKTNSLIIPSTFIPSTILGLLALILGFTFSMSVARYDIRKKLVLEEANAIGTAYLRAQTLPNPYRNRISQNLKLYVEERIRFYTVGADLDNILDSIGRAEVLQKLIWSDVKELAVKHQNPVTALFISSMNEVIDISGERTFAIENHVPEVVYLIIFVVTLIGLGSIGYIEGSANTRSWSGVLTLSLLFALVIALIQDIDRPRRGLIHISQGSLIRLQQSFEEK